MKNSILSATFSFAIFLDAAATFAGQWTEVPGAGINNSGLNGAAVVSANDVWAVGSLGPRALIEHWDGTNWSVAANQPPPSLLNGVAALSSSDVWAVGQNGVHNSVEHWNGQRWVVVPSPIVGTYDVLTAVCAISHNDAWAVGFSISPAPVYILMHWDGTSWSLVKGPPAEGSALSSLKAFATDDVWAVGSKDNSSSIFTVHWDGTAWSEVPGPNVDNGNYLFSLDGASPSDVWAVGSSSVGALAMHWDGIVWTVVPTPVDNGWFIAVKAFSPTNVCAVGTAAETSGSQPLSARWDGMQWRVIPTPPVNAPGVLSAISGRDGSIWAVGNEGNQGNEGRPATTDLIFKWTP
jgi:hypothetical protein